MLRNSLHIFFCRIRVVFLMGRSQEKFDQEFIEKENKKFGDILQSDVSDIYEFLPEKVLFALVATIITVYKFNKIFSHIAFLI